MLHHEALEACSKVAGEEYVVAAAALREAEAIAWRIKAVIASISARAANDGNAISDARARLKECEAKLEATLSVSLRVAKDSLAAKHSSLNRFTVTLFGRTMAGKSTIREALTCGDGTTIGKGAQRTTRDVRGYDWNSLRIIDTPGIGAYDGEEDKKLAITVIDETDVVLFLLSSDGIQDESFKGMQLLRQQNKPIIFVLNAKRDLQKPVFMRRFLANPLMVFDDQEMRGHIDRVHRLAGEFLGMRDIRVLAIHAQAAYLSTREEHRDVAEALYKNSRCGNLLAELESEVSQRGTVRRIQTLLDGTLQSLVDLQEELREEAKILRRSADYLRDKFQELEVWFQGFGRSVNSRITTEAAQLVKPLRVCASSFIDENIERSDVNKRWQGKVKALFIDKWLTRQQKSILDELHGRLASFSKEMSAESDLVTAFEYAGPTTFDPWDIKRSLRWASAGGAALAGVAAVAVLVAETNFWNPVGWVATGVSVIALGLSWIFDDREKTLQRQKATAAHQLRGAIDKLELEVVSALKKWFYETVTSRMVRGIRCDTKMLWEGMLDVARALEEGSRNTENIVEHVNRRLLVRVGHFVGTPLHDTRFGKVVRDPGIQTKFLWAENQEDTQFCLQVGLAIGERIDGITEGSPQEMVAAALRPAVVWPTMVSISGQNAAVHLPQREVDRANGKGGTNISLASRLVGFRINIVPKERP